MDWKMIIVKAMARVLIYKINLNWGSLPSEIQDASNGLDKVIILVEGSDL